MKELKYVVIAVILAVASISFGQGVSISSESAAKAAAEKAAIASVSGIVISHQVWWGVEERQEDGTSSYAGRWVSRQYVYDVRTKQLLELRYVSVPAAIVITEAHSESWLAPAPALPEDDDDLQDFLGIESVRAAISARNTDPKWRRENKKAKTTYYYWGGADYMIRGAACSPKG